MKGTEEELEADEKCNSIAIERAEALRASPRHGGANEMVVTTGHEQKTRAEHVAWCKVRALEYLPHDPRNATASMMSDMNKHPESARSMAGGMGVIGMFEVANGAEAVRRWIEGFNE